MKLNLKVILPFLAGIIVCYAACNKAKNTPVPASQTPTAGADVVSSQVALSLHKSLAGLYGGIKINDGIKTPSIITRSATSTLCGFTVDSVLNYNSNAGDTTSHTNGRIIFYFSCANGVPNGYFANDTLNTTGTAPGYSFQYNIAQYYAITSLNSANTLLSVNGNLVSFVNVTYSTTGIKPTADSTAYVLTGLTVDLTNNDDITSGTATFVTTGSTNYGPWNYTGTIKFLGNHTADITINGKVYPVTF
jgi:hypothetical protein